MTIEAIDAGIDFASDEPLRERRFPDADFFPGAKPGQFFRRLTPELVGIFERSPVELVIFLETADPRGFGELGRRLKNPFLLQHRFDINEFGRRGGRWNCRGGRRGGHGKKTVRELRLVTCPTGVM